MLAAMLFTIGAVGLLVRRNVLVMFMCVELMLNAVNLTFVTFAKALNDIGGQVIVFFTLVVAAAEVAVGLGDHRGHLPAPQRRDRRRRRPARRADGDDSMSARDLLDLVWIVPRCRCSARCVLLLFGKRIGEPTPAGSPPALMALAFVVVGRDVLRACSTCPHEARVNVSQPLHLVPGRARCTVDIGFLADPLSVTWILLVTGVGSLIHLYSIGYMHGDPRFSGSSPT